MITFFELSGTMYDKGLPAGPGRVTITAFDYDPGYLHVQFPGQPTGKTLRVVDRLLAAPFELAPQLVWSDSGQPTYSGREEVVFALLPINDAAKDAVERWANVWVHARHPGMGEDGMNIMLHDLPSTTRKRLARMMGCATEARSLFAESAQEREGMGLASLLRSSVVKEEAPC